MGKRAKQELRGEMRRVLVNLDRRWVEVASRELCKNLSTALASPAHAGIEHILAWIGFFPGEIDLSAFIHDEVGNRSLYLPQIRDGTMNFISIGKDWIHSMESGAYGIPEPRSAAGKPYDPATASTTAVLVPGLAFDREGARLGRGKGFYDTFLGRTKLLSVRKIGLCWSLQLLPKVPTESHDIFMDSVITEDEIVTMSDR